MTRSKCKMERKNTIKAILIYDINLYEYYINKAREYNRVAYKNMYQRYNLKMND